MREPKRALTDLRATAQAGLFADWRATPELKAKLRQRIAAEAGEGAGPDVEAGPRAVRRVQATPPQRKALGPWVRRGAVATVAVAAVVAMAMLGQSPELLEGGRPAANPAPAQDQYGSMVTPAPAAVPPAMPQEPQAIKTPVVGTADVVTVNVLDANGNTVNGATNQSVTLNAKLVDLQNQGGVSFTSASATSATSGPTVPATESQPGRKIILNAEYTLEVTDAVTAMQRLQNLAATTAGYMVDAALNKGEDGSWAGRLTLRLPSSLYNGAITEIRTIGEVKQERQWTQDVTDRYLDLEARIRIQQEYELKLQELAAKAATFDDWMKLTRQINDTRALIEQMQGSIKLLANQVEYSTINISFFQPAPDQVKVEPPAPAKGLWPAMTRSFGRSLQWFAGLGQALLVGAAAFAPFLVALLIIGVAALAIWRRLRSRKPIA